VGRRHGAPLRPGHRQQLSGSAPPTGEQTGERTARSDPPRCQSTWERLSSFDSFTLHVSASDCQIRKSVNPSLSKPPAVTIWPSRASSAAAVDPLAPALHPASPRRRLAGPPCGWNVLFIPDVGLHLTRDDVWWSCAQVKATRLPSSADHSARSRAVVGAARVVPPGQAAES